MKRACVAPPPSAVLSKSRRGRLLHIYSGSQAPAGEPPCPPSSAGLQLRHYRASGGARPTRLLIGRPVAAVIGVHGTPYASFGRAAVPGRPAFRRARRPALNQGPGAPRPHPRPRKASKVWASPSSRVIFGCQANFSRARLESRQLRRCSPGLAGPCTGPRGDCASSWSFR
jgi:hypothetical protein